MRVRARSLAAAAGIAAEHWGRDPTGVYSGGYNLYITPRELARFGLLLANDGNWEGEQLVDPSWLQQATSAAVSVDNEYDYGYLFWLRTLAAEPIAIAWGYGGQFVYFVGPARRHDRGHVGRVSRARW